MMFIVVTMFFGGGLIPSYLLIKSLGLIDSRWVLIIPGLISTFSLLILRNFFMGIPEELEDSAKIDGAMTCEFCSPLFSLYRSRFWLLLGFGPPSATGMLGSMRSSISGSISVVLQTLLEAFSYYREGDPMLPANRSRKRRKP